MSTERWRGTILQLKSTKRIAFVCVANSARSQIAEGIARALAPDGVEVWSAGSKPTKLNDQAVRSLADIGIDISGHHAKSLSDIPLRDIDAVVALCSEEQCPVLPAGVLRIDWSLPDPAGAPDEPAAFADVRDELRRRLTQLFS
jgi:protein-tyrosine-phosphatase